MSAINSLKQCDTVSKFNEFVTKLEVNGHRFEYKNGDQTQSYTLNQITNQFNKCKKNSEAYIQERLLYSPFKKNRLDILQVDVNEGIEKINEMASKLTPTWKTPIQNAWYALTHKGFNKDKTLQKIQTAFPKDVNMVVTKIGKELTKEPSFEDLEARFQKEGYSLKQLIQDNTQIKILNKNLYIKAAVDNHILQLKLENIANHLPNNPSMKKLLNAFNKNNLSLDAIVQNEKDLKILLKNKALCQILISYAKANLLQPALLNAKIKDVHLETLIETLLYAYRGLNFDDPSSRLFILEKIGEALNREGRTLTEATELQPTIELFKNSKLSQEFASYSQIIGEMKNKN